MPSRSVYAFITERGLAVAHHHLERGQQHVGELPGADRHGRQVAARPRRRVPDEVLERRHDPGCLEPAHVRRADGADQVRILADGLLDAAPSGVAHDVEHRGQPLMHADRAHVGADAARHLLDELGVERRAPRQRHRVGGRAVRGEARQAFLVHERRNAEPARRDDALLQPGERLRPERRIDRRGAEGPRDLAEPLGQQRIEIHGAGHLVLVRGHVGAVIRGADPDAVELGDLLLEGELGDERTRARTGRGSDRSRHGASVVASVMGASARGASVIVAASVIGSLIP